MSDSSTASSFRLGKILLIVFPLALVMVGGAILWGYMDIGEVIARWGRPALVPVKGKVLFEGKPLVGATVETQYENRDFDGAIGFTNDQGVFELMTDTDLAGGRMGGAYVGKHKVTIRRPDPTANNGAAQPPMMTPPEYGDFEKTPVVVNVSRQTAESVLEIVVEGKAIYQNPELAGGRKPPEVDQEQVKARVAMIMSQTDKDMDGKLSMEEAAQIDRSFSINGEAADSSKDGFVDEAELSAAVARIATAFPGGGGGRGGAGGGGGGGFDPEAIFTRLDTDMDGKLSTEEMDAIPEQFRDAAKANDKNGDGFVDKEEYLAGMAQLGAGRGGAGRGGPPGGGPPGGGRPGGGFGGPPGGGPPGGGPPGGGPPGGGGRPGAGPGPGAQPKAP